MNILPKWQNFAKFGHTAWQSGVKLKAMLPYLVEF